MKKSERTQFLLIFSLIILMSFFSLSFAHAKSVLYGYTPGGQAVVNLTQEAFMKKYPDIEVKFTSGGNGPMATRIIAEKDNPLASVVFGMMEGYLKTVRDAGGFEPYRRKEIDKVDKRFKDPDDFFYGDNIVVVALGVNTKILKEKNLPMPKTWEDLVNPGYKGLINVASPAQSGTAMILFTNLYDMFGGWDLIDKIHKNIFQYNTSGSAAARQAARGEVVIGITFDFAITPMKKEGFPIEIVYPPNSIYDIEGSALLHGAKSPTEAKLFLDFLSSKEYQTALAKIVSGVTRTDIKVGGDGSTSLSDLKLYKLKKNYDIKKFADEWSKRFGK